MKTFYKYLMLIYLLMTFGDLSASTTYIGPRAVDLGLSVIWSDRNMIDINQKTIYYYWGQTSSGGNGITENFKYPSSICGTEYDVVTETYGDGWRMPTAEEYKELCEKCTSTCNGNGVTFKAPNGNSITFEAVGHYNSSGEKKAEPSYYWTGTQANVIFNGTTIINTGDPNNPNKSLTRYAVDAFTFTPKGINENVCTYITSNEYQCAIRPVKDKTETAVAAYAVLNNGTLTFYYDNNKSSRSGTKYDVEASYSGSKLPDWARDSLSVKKAVFDSSFAGYSPTSTAYWFGGYYNNLTSISNLTYLNTSKVTSMRGMFLNCKSLKELDLSSFNTANVTDMTFMFTGCESLRSLKVSFFNTSKVTSMGSMFTNCSQLTTLELRNFDTSNVTDMGWMFYGCKALTQLNISSFDTSKVTQMRCMFYDCISVEELDVSGFNTENVTDMGWMFTRCGKIKSLYATGFYTSKVTDMYAMFYSCTSLTTIYAKSGTWDTGKVTNSGIMFGNCSSLVGGMGTQFNSSHIEKDYAHIDGGSSNPGYFTDIDAIEAYAVLNNGTLTFYYDGKKENRTGTTYSVKKAYLIVALKIPGQMPGWYADRAKIKKAVFDASFAKFRATATTLWFYDCANMTTINGLENFSMEKVTDMRFMFYNCQSLTSLDLSSFNTANATKTSGMFNGCTSLNTIYASDFWNVDNVTESGNMFYNCTMLVGGKGTKFSSVHIDKEYAHIDGGVINPGYLTLKGGGLTVEAYAVLDNNVLTFYYDGFAATRTGTHYSISNKSTPTWYDDRDKISEVRFTPSFVDYRPVKTSRWFVCKNLTAIKDIGYLNTSQVNDMNRMFYNCEQLVSLDLGSFDTRNVTSMSYMFNNCKSLKKLDVSSFNTANVTDMSDMFNSIGVESLDLSNFETSKVTDMNFMFAESSSLMIVDLSNFNTENVKDMGYMFCGCNFATLDLSSFNTANVTNMRGMFLSNSSLTTIMISTKWNVGNVENSTDMFKYCKKLVGSKGTKYDANHLDKEYAHADGGTSNPGYLTLRTPASSESTQAYVVLNDGKLTFYYDNKRNSRTGQKYTIKSDYRYYGDGELGNRFPAWTSPAGNGNVTSAVFDSSFANYRPTNTVCWFFRMSNLTSIKNMEYLNTSEVTDMSAMFRYCSNLPTVDVSNFDTRNVTDMSFMFCFCFKLAKLDVSKFNTSKVTNMQHMFHSCKPLTNLNVSNFNTANVTNMSVMFADLPTLSSLDVSRFNTAKTTNMYAMFNNCTNLRSLNLKSFNSSKVVIMRDMFVGCTTLKTIYASNLWSTSAVIYGGNMFTDCNVLVGGMGTKYDAAHVDYDYARIDEGRCNPGYFTGDAATVGLGPKEAYAALEDGVLTFYYDSFKECTTGKIYPIEKDYTYTNLPAWHEDRAEIVTGAFDGSFADYRPTNTSFWFYDLNQMTVLNNVANLKTSEVTKMAEMFYGCKKLASLDVSGFNTSKVTTMHSMFNLCESLTTIAVNVFNTANVTDMEGMFWDCKNLTKLDVSGFNTAKVTTMYGMFYNCKNLTIIDVSHFNTANVKNMRAMFMQCEVLKELNLKNFNTAKVENMNSMFYMCYTLQSLDVSSFNTVNVTDMCHTFDWLRSVKTLDLSNFNTSKVTTMRAMFSGNDVLESINISSFDTRNVIDMEAMFNQCPKLKSIDISSFNTAKVENMYRMFSYNYELTTIYAGDGWTTASVKGSDLMFAICSKLVGGAGTKFDTNHIDYTYARIDGGSNNPGYFTYKTAGIKGDVNGDGVVDVADIASIISAMTGQGGETLKKAADVNGDGVVDVADIATVISRMTELARLQQMIVEE